MLLFSESFEPALATVMLKDREMGYTVTERLPT